MSAAAATAPAAQPDNKQQLPAAAVAGGGGGGSLGPPPRNSMLAQLGHQHLAQQQSHEGQQQQHQPLHHHPHHQQQPQQHPFPPPSFVHPRSRGDFHTVGTGFSRQPQPAHHLAPIISSSSSTSSQTTLNQTSDFELPFDDQRMISSQFMSSSHHHPVAGTSGSHRPDVKRPDSVITTSSIVSSSDTASQAGDSSAESSHGGPPSAYTITGLYGPPKQQRLPRPEEPASKAGKELPVVPAKPVPSTSTAVNPHVLLAKTNSSKSTTAAVTDEANGHHLKSALVNNVKTHRRQISYPVTFQPINGGASDGAKPCCAGSTVRADDLGAAIGGSVAAAAAGGGPARPCTVVRHGSNPINGHKRSHSYGHHRPAMQGHRRTGSSVIETLQTLSCASAGDGTYCHHHEASLAQFLETLRKEQQEKCEKQELHLMQDELEDLRDCGIGACKPKFLQSLANIKVFVFLLSILVTLQQALSSGYLNSAITTIEKRYEIPSSISGIIASMYEIGNVITVIFVSYLGSRRHIPVWIGMGCLVMGIGSITFSFPHFLMGPYDVSAGGNQTASNICNRRDFQHTGHSPHSSAEGNLLEKIPVLTELKSLTEGLSSPPLAPHNNQYNREDNCIEQADESSALPIFIFMIAQLLLGCGGSPLFTLGTTYIDNHVKRDSSSMYIGFMYSMCAFGPVCGFLLGAYLLSHHVDTFTADVSNFSYTDSTDRNWIGMWWGGFLICGASLILISIPFFFFPKELKKEKVKVYIDEKYHHATDPSIRPPKKQGAKSNGSTPAVSKSSTLDNQIAAAALKRRNDEAVAAVAAKAAEAAAEEEGNAYGKDIKDIPKSTWKLLTNKIYMVTCLGACTELIIVSGFIVFLPKYLETQFNLSKSMASMFTGGIAIPGACIGIFFGGYLLKRLQLRPSGAVQLVLFFNVLCLSCYALLFFFGCENVKMAGTTMPYEGMTSGPGGMGTPPGFQINLTASCNFGCECDMNDVQPVCGANGLTYFSPCHAGCTSVGTNKNNYTNCACVLKTMEDDLGLREPLGPLAGAFSGGGGDHTPMGGAEASAFTEVTMIPVATAGPCYTNCQMVMPFMVLLFFMTLVVAVTQMPVLMVVLRAVEEEEKAFALGIQFVIFRLFGYIPSPILFGNVIDSTCLLWKSTCQGEQGGRCLMYDIEMFRYKYVGVCCGIKVLSCIIFCIDWWLIKRRQDAEKKQSAMTVGEIVNSIISLDKLFDPEGPLWVQMVDAENPECPNEDAITSAESAVENSGAGSGGNRVAAAAVETSAAAAATDTTPPTTIVGRLRSRFSRSARASAHDHSTIAAAAAQRRSPTSI